MATKHVEVPYHRNQYALSPSLPGQSHPHCRSQSHNCRTVCIRRADNSGVNTNLYRKLTGWSVQNILQSSWSIAGAAKTRVAPLVVFCFGSIRLLSNAGVARPSIETDRLSEGFAVLRCAVGRSRKEGAEGGRMEQIVDAVDPSPSDISSSDGDQTPAPDAVGDKEDQLNLALAAAKRLLVQVQRGSSLNQFYLENSGETDVSSTDEKLAALQIELSKAEQHRAELEAQILQPESGPETELERDRIETEIRFTERLYAEVQRQHALELELNACEARLRRSEEVGVTPPQNLRVDTRAARPQSPAEITQALNKWRNTPRGSPGTTPTGRASPTASGGRTSPMNSYSDSMGSPSHHLVERYNNLTQEHLELQAEYKGKLAEMLAREAQLEQEKERIAACLAAMERLMSEVQKDERYKEQLEIELETITTDHTELHTRCVQLESQVAAQEQRHHVETRVLMDTVTLAVQQSLTALQALKPSATSLQSPKVQCDGRTKQQRDETAIQRCEDSLLALQRRMREVAVLHEDTKSEGVFAEPVMESLVAPTAVPEVEHLKLTCTALETENRTLVARLEGLQPGWQAKQAYLAPSPKTPPKTPWSPQSETANSSTGAKPANADGAGLQRQPRRMIGRRPSVKPNTRERPAEFGEAAPDATLGPDKGASDSPWSSGFVSMWFCGGISPA